MAGLLAYCSAELADNAKVTVAKAKEFLPWMPECYRLYDVLSEADNWQDRQRWASAAPKALGERLYSRLAAMPDLPAGAATIVKPRAEGKGLWAGLLGGSKPKEAPGDEFEVRAKLMAALLAADKPGDKPGRGAGQPGRAVLGGPGALIREVSFLQSWEQMRTHYGDDEFLAKSRRWWPITRMWRSSTATSARSRNGRRPWQN